MKNIIPFLVVIILVLSGLGAVAITVDDKTYLIDNTAFILYDDELDQYQTEITENLTIPIGQIFINDTSIINVQLAQSFIPTKEIITKVELLITKNATTTYPLIVSIRKELTDEDLVSININADQVPTEEFVWVIGNFNDTRLIPGQTYYIVALTENTTDNYYGWYGNNTTESYPFGCLWYSIDDGNTWGNESSSSNQNNIVEWIYQHNKPRFDEDITWDMCFKTYGRESIAPSAPIISGKTQGKIGTEYEYIFNSADPDGDDVQYIIDWGDSKTIRTDFNASGIDVKISHSWSKKGTYYIKAKAEDIGGLVGPETTLKVKMPRIRTSEFAFFQRFSNLLQVMQKLLGLLT
jgi:hypothetical protein